MEIAYLQEKDLRVMIIKMSKELGRRMGAQNEQLEVFKEKTQRITRYEKIQ